jgi:hypothetical protein
MQRERPHAAPDRPQRAAEPAVLRSPDAFLLARTIGNRATASLLQRDTPVDAPRTFSDKGSGHSVRRVPVNGVTGGGFTDVAVAVIPDNLPANGGAVDVLLFMHGWLVRGAHGYDTKGGKEADDVAFHKLPQQMAAAGRPMVGVFPQGSGKSDFNRDKDPNQKDFDADTLIGDVFARVGAMKEWGATITTPPTPGRVIFAGHSGADIPMDQMLSGGKGPKNLGGIFLLDTLYDQAGHDVVVWKVSEKRLEQDLVRLSGMLTGNGAKDEADQVAWVRAAGFRLFDTYVPKGYYDESAATLQKKKDAWLKKPSTRAVLGAPGTPLYDAVSANLVFGQATTDHDHVVGAHLKDALATL